MKIFKPTSEQQKVLDYQGKNLIVSASAGSGKTSTLIELIASLIEKGCDVKRIMLLTFTKASASEMKERLISKLLSMTSNQRAVEALDDIATADISTIHSFLERVVKKNTNLLPIEDGFIILSDDEAGELKKQAFEKTEQEFKELSYDRYENLFIKFHNERLEIFKMIDTMSSFFASLPNSSKLLEKHKVSQQEYFDDAVNFIVEKFSKDILEVNINLNHLKNKFEEEKFGDYINDLENLFDKNISFESLKKIASGQFKASPTSKKENQDYVIMLSETYKKAKKVKDELVKLSLSDEKLYNRENAGLLEKEIYDFYDIYIKNFAELKRENNAIDFNDLESFTQVLLEKSEIKEELSSEYDYIFVDEYQDTNRVQESIIKTIALKSHFVAVGDPKQSIYGFRNATSEIIKSDIKAFTAQEDSSAEFLRLNFRSDPKILNFVNNVFKNIMTEKSVGIDYQQTSMLKAGSEDFKRSDLPSVRVDVFSPEKEKKEKDDYNVYEIFKDEEFQISTKNSQARLIALRINEILLKQIYDNKLDAFRNITYNDIVILTRGRGEIVGELIRELSLCGIPVVSEVKGNLKDEPEILVLVNLFKILLDFHDDVSLISVMASQIGGFTLDELASLRLSSTEKEFYKIVETSEDKKVLEFKEKIQNLKFIFEVKGAYQMLNDLLLNSDYYSYLSLKEDAENELFIIEKFLQIIKTYKNQFSLAGINEFLAQETIEYQGGGSSANAVTICTIHSSKGLEYPVVILADAGKSIIQTDKRKFVLNEKYGLAINYFSRDEEEVLLSPTVYMLKSLQSQKNFIDEIMLLYVAMTRAKNHLYIVGNLSQKNLNEISTDALEAKSYLEMILSAYSSLQNFDNKNLLLEECVESNIITEIEEIKIEKEQQTKYEEFDENEIDKYLNFEYPYKEAVKTTYKNSVSAINKDERISQSADNTDNIFIETGNAYHLALKEIDFEKINNVQDIEEEIEKNKNLFKIKDLIDSKIIYNNIILLKDILKNTNMVLKEKQFTSLVNLEEVNGNKEEVMIQGIVDLFALGEENILVDYKFTNNKNIDNLKNIYKKQLILYKKAIENAYKLKINKIFLLSLKNNKIIEI